MVRLLLLTALASACGRSWLPRGDSLQGDARPGDARPGDDPVCVVQTLAVTIAATEDDGEISREFDAGGTLFQDGETSYDSLLWVGAWANRPCEAYYRFTLPAVSASARVESANLELWGATNNWWRPDTPLVVGLEDSADAAVVTGPTDSPAEGNRDLIAPPVRWPDSIDWKLGVVNVSPDLSALLQSLVTSHGGLEAGARVQFWVWAEDTSINTQIGTDDFATPDSHPAVLRLTVCQ